MLIIVAGSRWAGNAGRAAGWRAGTFGCGDANQAAGEGEGNTSLTPRLRLLAVRATSVAHHCLPTAGLSVWIHAAAPPPSPALNFLCQKHD